MSKLKHTHSTIICYNRQYFAESIKNTMLPVIAIIGRPNVGKSTLFNRITKSRNALVADLPGLTRDRQYGEGEFHGQKFLVIDTGGIGVDARGVDTHMIEQAKQALQEADAILFLVDGKAGRTAADEVIASQVRHINKPVQVVVNKTESIDPALAMAEFYAMGLGQPAAISAAHNQGIAGLIGHILHPFKEQLIQIEEEEIKGVKVAIIGRPNVGKSTLVNRILGEERVIVYDEPGTTRDSIFIPFERFEKKYTIIDTAGMRRRSKIYQTIEKFSVSKSMQAIETANVVVYVIDARDGIVDQDLHLLGFILDTGRALVLAINKWDGMKVEEKEQVKKELDRRLSFLNFADIHFISALHGSGVGNLFDSIDASYLSATEKFSTSLITNILQEAVKNHPPPQIRGQRIKLRFAHYGGHNPPTIIIHGNQTLHLPMNYKRYLENFFYKALKLVGTPIRLEFKTGENPFEGKKNELSKRQLDKRRRLKKHVKKKGK